MQNPSVRSRWLPIARALVKLGHHPRLLLLHPTFDVMPEAERHFSEAGVEVEHVAQMHVYGLAGQRRYFGAGKLLSVASHAATALKAAILRQRPDVIQLCKPQPINGWAVVQAARQLGMPYYADCDDHEATANRMSNLAQRLVVRMCEDKLPQGARAVSVNTRFLWRHFAALGIPESRLRYIPNGIADDVRADPAHIPQNLLLLRESPVVLYVGAMSIVSHGVDLLLEAFAHVRQIMPNARLLMVGDGDDRAALQQRAEKLGVADGTIWTGRLPHSEALACYSLATCSVDPVFDWPAMRARSPLKIVESLACGVPVVTGDVGDRREMVGPAGVIVAAGDGNALATGIMRVLRSDRAEAHLRAIEQSANHRISTLAHTWLAGYSD